MDMMHKPHGAGRSSFELVDVNLIFGELALTPLTVFLDLGCGTGNYTIAAAKLLGPRAVIYGVDTWEEGLNELKQRAKAENLSNIVALRSDVNEHIPLESATVDVCFMATVLHDLLRESTGEAVMTEIARVLKPNGRLSIVEFKKQEDGPGPPVNVRLSPEETEKVFTCYGFVKHGLHDVGQYNYLMIASLHKKQQR